MMHRTVGLSSAMLLPGSMVLTTPAALGQAAERQPDQPRIQPQQQQQEQQEQIEQRQQRTQQQAQQQQAQQQQQAFPQLPSGEVTGEIIRTKDVPFRDRDVEHKVVLLRTEEGRQVPVDLGAIETLQNNEIDLETGEQITVQGHAARVGDKRVIMANLLEVEDRTIQIDREQTPWNLYNRQVRGEIIHNKEVPLEGTDLSNMVVLLRTEDDNWMVADLGSVDALRELEIEEGQELQVEGRVISRGDRPVVVAESVTVDERQVQVQRPELEQVQQLQPQTEREGIRTQPLTPEQRQEQLERQREQLEQRQQQLEERGEQSQEQLEQRTEQQQERLEQQQEQLEQREEQIDQ